MTCLSRILILILALALSPACTSDDGTTSAGSTGDGSSSTSASTSASTSTTNGGSASESSSGGSGTSASSTGTSTSGTTSDASSTSGGPVACDPNNLPGEGTPCANEGEFCSPGCEDPCEFCNVVKCENGTWQGLEVFPADCLSCEEVCPLVLNGQCPAGPPDLDACVAGCGANEAGECGLLYHKAIACIGATPAFTCDLVGRPTVARCAAEFEALYACIMP